MVRPSKTDKGYVEAFLLQVKDLETQRAEKRIKPKEFEKQISTMIDRIYADGFEDASNECDDAQLINWLCDHAILLGVLKSDGESEYIKVEGNDLSFRDIVTKLKV